ncbi:MAG: ASCH domain-containing protein [Atopobiaceae bacterium]|nr:ASCH domain-containing protein [Atopobiaceae bacterium]
MKAMLSIRPEYVDRILAGEKTYEYRRRTFKNPDVDSILIYCTSPRSAVVGEVAIERILESSPQELWDTTSKSGGIDYDSFMEYFKGVTTAYAIKLGEVLAFDTPKPIEDYAPTVKRAPQSFVYVD